MSKDRPLHDDKFLAELAAFDELLRKPLEPERPPKPPAQAPAPAEPLHKPSEAARPPMSSAPPSAERLRKRAEAVRPRKSPVPPRAERLRKPAEPARPPAPPPGFGLTEREELVPSSRDIDALSVATTLPPQRRFRVSWLSVAALTAGILGGGPLGWWLAVNLFVSTPPAEPVDPTPSITAPATTRPPAPRSAPRRAASNAAPRAAAMPNAAARNTGAPNVAASSTAPGTAARMDAGEVGFLATPMMSAPSPAAGGAGIPSTTIAPAPSIDFPLAATPSPIAPLLPPAVAGAGALTAVVADEAAIERALRQYKDAYEHLDAKAASAVWPTVDQRALSRAFAGLASQSLDFRGCEVVVRAGASKATASCSGTAEYVRKVGDARVRVEPRQWTFTLNKTQGAWRIEAVDGSR
jgi:hypothetical protein